MGKIREFDPRNLGISELFKRNDGIQVNIMPGQHVINGLREALNQQGIVTFTDYQTLLFVSEVGNENIRIVSNIYEEYFGKSKSRLIYGIFTPEGQLLPDPYACAIAIGRYQQLSEVQHQIVELLK